VPTREPQSGLHTGDEFPATDNTAANLNQTTTRNDKTGNRHTASLNTLKPLAGGWFHMGTDQPLYRQDGESPRRPVFVSPFAIAASTVSNAEFARFIAETGYVTSAERLGWSFVFSPAPDSGSDTASDIASKPTDNSDTANNNRVAYAPWWCDTEAACWHAPSGQGSSIADIPDHPVTHVSYTDALHYCDWSGTSLPTEAQWEYAARGNHDDCSFPWGDTLAPNGKYVCNIWQGEFPVYNTALDGYSLTAPVNAYPANSFGLYNMIGNVWEWVADRYTNNHSPRPVKNPTGPLNGGSFVTRGGSFLCHHTYCARYHVFSRQALTPETSCANVGFRVATLPTSK